MLSKMNLFMCALALLAFGVIAQEKGGKAELQAGNAQGKAQSQRDDAQNRTGTQQQSQKTGDAQSRSQTRTSETRTEGQPGATESRTAETREYRRGDASANNLDAIIASCLLLGNQKEVEISQFAAERAQNEKVKQFAKQMVEQHTQGIAKLQRFAGADASRELGSAEPSRTRSETNVTERESTRTREKRDATTSSESTTRTPAGTNERTPSDANARTGTGRDAAGSPQEKATGRDAAGNPQEKQEKQERRTATERSEVPGQPGGQRDRSVTTSVEVRTEHDAMPDKMKAIEREAAQKFVALVKSNLEQSSNFDQAYVGGQISAHLHMVAHLETYRSYASEELRQVIQESHSMAQQHLRQATELVQELGSGSSGGARRAGENRRTGTDGPDATRNDDPSRPATGGIRARREERKEGTAPKEGTTPKEEGTPKN